MRIADETGAEQGETGAKTGLQSSSLILISKETNSAAPSAPGCGLGVLGARPGGRAEAVSTLCRRWTCPKCRVLLVGHALERLSDCLNTDEPLYTAEVPGEMARQLIGRWRSRWKYLAGAVEEGRRVLIATVPLADGRAVDGPEALAVLGDMLARIPSPAPAKPILTSREWALGRARARLGPGEWIPLGYFRGLSVGELAELLGRYGVTARVIGRRVDWRLPTGADAMGFAEHLRSWIELAQREKREAGEG